MLQRLDRSETPMRIVHVLRAPVGGLFRHVLDLASEQIARGHQVGLITDSMTGGEMAAEKLAKLLPNLALGLLRLPIHRLPRPSDLPALLAVKGRIAELKPDVVHGHGSKGGAYARACSLFPSAADAIRAYTPHGGSLNYQPGSLSHHVFMVFERLLSYRTDALLFESAFIARRYHEFVGDAQGIERVIPNGISSAEFVPVAPKEDAADLLYVGEFRAAKGLDTLIDALGLLARDNLRPSLVMVGDGPEREQLAARAKEAGVADQLDCKAPMRARHAFTLGRTMVVPSRFESLPYIVLEAAGACIPMITTNVGGMGEIYGPYSNRLIASDNPLVLAEALRQALNETPEQRADRALALHDYVASRFTIPQMVNQILDAYRDAVAARRELVMQ